MHDEFAAELYFLDFDPNINDGMRLYGQLQSELEKYKSQGMDKSDPVLYQHFSNLLDRLESILGAWRSQFRLDKSGRHWTYQKDEPESELNEKTKTAYSEMKGEWDSAVRIHRDYGGKYKMAKGYTAGGKGIDQIWVSKDWSDVKKCPDGILVVESKFGSSKVNPDHKVYQGAIGLDGQPLEDGCSQMMPDWVYVNARTIQSTSEGIAQRKDPIDFARGAPTLERTRLFPLSPSSKIGQCLADGVPHQLAKTNTTIKALEVQVKNNRTTKVVDHTQNWAVSNRADSNVFDAMKTAGTQSATTFVTEVCADKPTDTTVIARKKILAGNDVVAQKHLLNVQKRRETLARRMAAIDSDIESYNESPYIGEEEEPWMDPDQWEAFLDMVRQYSPEDFVEMAHGDKNDDEENLDLPIFDENSDLWKEYSVEQIEEIKRLMLKKAAMANDFAEVNGEEAAAFFMSENGYSMAKGFTEPGPGIDQIWFKPPNWHPSSKKPPDEIVVVEAKGSPNANVSSWDAYIGSAGKDGKPMLQGCKQMTPEWVWHHANTMTKESDLGTNPIGEYIKQGLEKGNPPALLGVVLKQENMTSSIDNTNYQFLMNVPRTDQGALVYN